MKIYAILFAVLVAFGLQTGYTQQIPVSDLAGSYACLTQGAPASLAFEVDGQHISFEFCWNTHENACQTYQNVYPWVVNGAILAKGQQVNSPTQALENLLVRVAEVQGRYRITVMSGDGVDYIFERQ